MERIRGLDGHEIGELRMFSRFGHLTYSSLHRLDPQNVDHLFMRFYVEGEINKATVRLEMTKVSSGLLSNCRANMTLNTSIVSSSSSLNHVSYFLLKH